jgi:PAS domain S-box-containing protein
LKLDSIGELLTLWTYSSDAFLILDKKAKILYANPALEQVSGIGLKSQVGKTISELIKRGIINDSASLKAIQQKKIITSELNTAAGKKLLSTASPVIDSASGKLERVVCNIRSMSIISKEKKAQGITNEECRLNGSIGPVFYKKIKIDGGKYELVYISDKMDLTVKLACQLSGVDSTVLILGETGVGKDLIARLIHDYNLHNDAGNFIKVNCAAIAKTLIESELFGYEPGSFTGALKFGKPGFVELAKGGTLFLDEVAELPLETQAKLLGVLQDREYFKVGGTKKNVADVRIIAATNQDLQEMVNNGKFRKDLFYRLNVIPVEVPPLRARKEDIPALIYHFKAKLKEKYGIEKEISDDIIHHLYAYPWPGNVRELQSLVERLMVTVPQDKISLADLPKTYVLMKPDNTDTLKEKIKQYEWQLVKEALEQSDNKLEAARKLGISLSSLFRKMQYKI